MAPAPPPSIQPPSELPPIQYRIAGDNKVLFDPKATHFLNQPGQYTVGGQWYFLNPTAQHQSEKASDDFNVGQEAANAAQNTKAELEFMNSEYDRLKGTVLQTGFMGESRLKMGMALNTAIDFLKLKGADINPDDYKVDEAATAAGQNILKSGIRLGYNYTKLAFGSQREAAQTIQTSLKAVPGLQNSYYGGKAMMATIGALADREIDLRNFQTEWMNDPRSHGSLYGSVDEFNRQHPGAEYANKVLEQLGLNKGGFINGTAIDKAFEEGYINEKVAGAARFKLWKRDHPDGQMPPPAPAPKAGGTTPGPDTGVQP
jgi:hypothetical protein